MHYGKSDFRNFSKKPPNFGSSFQCNFQRTDILGNPEEDLCIKSVISRYTQNLEVGLNFLMIYIKNKQLIELGSNVLKPNMFSMVISIILGQEASPYSWT